MVESRKRGRHGGSVVATDDREVVGSNPAGATWKLWQFPLPHFASDCRTRH